MTNPFPPQLVPRIVHVPPRFVVLVPHQVILAGGQLKPKEGTTGDRYFADLEDAPVPHLGELFELHSKGKFCRFSVQQVCRAYSVDDPTANRTSVGLVPVEANVPITELRAWLAQIGFRKE